MMRLSRSYLCSAATKGLDGIDKWLHKPMVVPDTLSLSQAKMMDATLSPAPRMASTIAQGQPLPALWHWSYFLESVPRSGLGEDGHAKGGHFLPPVPLPNRMWAGGSVTWRKTGSNGLRIGQSAEKTSTVESVVPKHGRTGELLFMYVKHTVSVDGEVAVEEMQNLVYTEDHHKKNDGNEKKDEKNKKKEKKEIDKSSIIATMSTDEVLLFRYSALTFNGHRIHYDIDYCREVGYPGLIVHGPLQATWLANIAEKLFAEKKNTAGGQQFLGKLEYKAVSPVFLGKEVYVARRPDTKVEETGGVALQTISEDGIVSMVASAWPAEQ